MRETEKEGDRERGRQRKRETKKEGDKTKKEGDKERGRQRKRERKKEGDKERGRQRKRETKKEGDKERGRQRKRETKKEGERQRGRETKREREKEGERERAPPKPTLLPPHHLLHVCSSSSSLLDVGKDAGVLAVELSGTLLRLRAERVDSLKGARRARERHQDHRSARVPVGYGHPLELGMNLCERSLRTDVLKLPAHPLKL